MSLLWVFRHYLLYLLLGRKLKVLHDITCYIFILLFKYTKS